MFEGDYTINGIHATYIKYLKDEVKAFERYIDVYMTGVTMGVLHNRRAKQGDQQIEREYMLMRLIQNM